MFSGIGGFELGIQKAKPEAQCVGFSEIDKYAVQVYLNHYPNHKNYGDATTIDPKQLPDFDLLVGGFPCQAFSVAGKRRGFDDTRGTLFFDIARILREKKPRLCLLENVKGLLSHDDGRTFKTIIATLIELGYSVEWQVLNSKNFGVPQNRERVFIVGHLGGISGRQVFPVGEAERTVGEGFESSDTEGEVAQTLRSRYGNGSGSHISTVVPTLRATDSKRGDNQTVVIEPVVGTIDRGQFRETGGVALNLPATYHKGHDNHGARPMLSDGVRIRRLTPTECERLQAFPDGWTQGLSDTQRYKTLGNSVTVNVIEYLASRLPEVA